MEIKNKNTEPIEDIYVAKVLDTGKIVINKGANDGITAGMEFVVYEKGEEICDPITQKKLGVLENAKGGFRAFHIQEGLTVLLAKKNLQPSLLSLASMVVDNETKLLQSIKVGDSVRITNIM